MNSIFYFLSCYSISVQYGQTPLHGASAQGHLPIVKYLVEAGADPSMITDSVSN